MYVNDNNWEWSLACTIPASSWPGRQSGAAFEPNDVRLKLYKQFCNCYHCHFLLITDYILPLTIRPRFNFNNQHEKSKPPHEDGEFNGPLGAVHKPSHIKINFLDFAKGQSISKGLFYVFNSSKKWTKNVCPSRLGQNFKFSSSFLEELKKQKRNFEIN